MMVKKSKFFKLVHKAIDPDSGLPFMMSDPFIAVEAETFGASARVCIYGEFEDGTGGVMVFEYVDFERRDGVFRFEFWGCQQYWPHQIIKLSDEMKRKALGI